VQAAGSPGPLFEASTARDGQRPDSLRRLPRRRAFWRLCDASGGGPRRTGRARPDRVPARRPIGVESIQVLFGNSASR
jgi:hypothetical protein